MVKPKRYIDELTKFVDDLRAQGGLPAGSQAIRNPLPA
jgi:hypothetical protein